MEEIEKTSEEKSQAVTPVTPTTGNGTQPGQQQETPAPQNKKISDTPDTDEQKEETIKGETEKETTGSETAVDSTEEQEEGTETQE